MVWLALAAILGVACWLRVQSLDFGLPDVYHPDETPILNRALTFAKGDPNPHNFLYPTLYLYATFAWEGLFFVCGRLAGWYDSLAGFQREFFIDPSRHFLAARLLTALCGTLTVVAVYRFGARLYERPVGIGAALFTAVAPFAVRDAHYVKLDVPVALFVVLTHAALATIVVDPTRAQRRSTWLGAGLLAGLAMSTQYYAAFLVVPFLAVALVEAQRSGRLGFSTRLLLWAGVATVAGFCLASPFFVIEWSSVVRDFRELHKVDIQRAVTHGLFSSMSRYIGMLAVEALGWPVFALGVAGMAIGLVTDWRRAVLTASFPLAFLAFLANTYPVGRYLNAMLPIIAVSAAYAVVRGTNAVAKLLWPSADAERVRTRAVALSAAVSIAAAIPGFDASIRWDRFLRQDDTRALARRFIEREIPSGTTVLIQPQGVQLRVSREALIHALRAHLGDERRASVKYQLQLAASTATPNSYSPLWLGQGLDVDKIYVPYDAVKDLAGVHRVGAQYVVLKTHRTLASAAAPLLSVLEAGADRMAVISPYPVGTDPASESAPDPFLHNTDARLVKGLDRPGPVISIWKLRNPR
jgi:hypothetical protein